MPGEFYFMSMGGLGLSLAGFAGLIAALGPSGEHPEIGAWRIVNIVKSGLLVTFLGFGTIAVTAVTDVPLSVRIISGIAAIAVFRLTEMATRAGPAWPDDQERVGSRRLLLATPLLIIPNVILGSVGYLHVILIGLLALPAGTLVTAVGGLTERHTT